MKILNSAVKVNDPEESKVKSIQNLGFKFQNVKFKYDGGDEDVLNNLNIEFEEGKFSALVGKSGSGKSTILNLLCRFFDPTSGDITLGGVSLRDLSQADLRKHIGFVFQESYVFSGSIEENLKYGKINATKDEIVEALEKANAWEFVSKLKKGVKTEIGERGVKLSGGQKQESQ
ncbi:MAG: ATP-binding cassette domain-containing protein [Candidatus Dojkabacteria bacterium]|nr:ATP-binding cassette domain-containing protein [Candidatus Dojkabacteria bacterium]